MPLVPGPQTDNNAIAISDYSSRRHEEQTQKHYAASPTGGVRGAARFGPVSATNRL